MKIIPERYAKSYLDWLGEKRDWPVSRQLWWGHRIPIWYEPGNSQKLLEQRDQIYAIQARKYPSVSFR
jgi:valyl-tRNA synthetase